MIRGGFLSNAERLFRLLNESGYTTKCVGTEWAELRNYGDT